MKSRLIQQKTYLIPGTKNPCGCGSNCWHYEDDGEHIYGVCNACGKDIYECTEDHLEFLRQEDKWVHKNKAKRP